MLGPYHAVSNNPVSIVAPTGMMPPPGMTTAPGNSVPPTLEQMIAAQFSPGMAKFMLGEVYLLKPGYAYVSGDI